MAGMAGRTLKTQSYKVAESTDHALKRIKLDMRFQVMDDVFRELLANRRELKRLEREQRAREKAS